MSHTCSVESGKEFMAGTTHVDCYPRDYPGLPGVNCQFFVHVVGTPIHGPMYILEVIERFMAYITPSLPVSL